MLFMNSSSDTEHRKEAIRRTILDAARETFIQEGYRSISMRRLANKTGYSVGALYLYFTGKDEIFDCLINQSFQRLAGTLAGLQQRSVNRDPVETLQKALYTYVDFGLRNSNDYRLALLIQPATGAVPGSLLSVFAALRAMVGCCLEQGRIPIDSEELRTQALWAAVHGVTSLLIQQPAFSWVGRERLIQEVVGNAISAIQNTDPARLEEITVRPSVA